MADSPSSSPGLLARIAQSAEYSIAAALLLVCGVVGASLWWLQPEEQAETEAPAASVAGAAAPAVDEREALDEARRRLGERFSELDEQQRRRLADDEARRERQRAEAAAAADARREADQARQQAETRAREQQAAARAAAPAAPTPAPAPAARRPAEIVDAAIDWSSCRRPGYPAGSVRRGEEGVVVIAADLDASAKIRQTRVAQSSGHEALDRATLEAVGKCRFSAATEDGVAKPATAQVRFTWKLQN
jgi:protein TonB